MPRFGTALIDGSFDAAASRSAIIMIAAHISTNFWQRLFLEIHLLESYSAHTEYLPRTLFLAS